MVIILSRRESVALLCSIAVAFPLVAFAREPAKRQLVGWLSGLTSETSSPYFGKFLQGMRELGYVEGRDFEMVYRFSDGYQDRLPALAKELVELKPAVIVATAVVTAVEARKLTSTIPIVSGALADAVHLGLIESEAHPGGNVTGIEPYLAGLPAKQMELAREIVPGASAVGVLTDRNDPKAPPQVHEMEVAGRALSVNVVVAGASQPEDLDSAMQVLANHKVKVVIVIQSSMLLSESRRIAESALARGLPTVCGYPAHVAAGGLISYGVDLLWCFQRVAYFVDRILRGTAPKDLPVEFPTKMLMVINLKTARALGVSVSPMLLGMADEVMP